MYQKIHELQNEGRSAVLVTITGSTGSIPREIGAKLLVTENESYGNLGGGTLEWLALEKARSLLIQLESARNVTPTYTRSQLLCGGVVELFFDLIQPKPRLLIFGAGAITQGLLEITAGTPFECAVIDTRPLWIEAAQKKKFQFSQLSLEVYDQHPLEWIEDHPHWKWPLTFALIATHEPTLDEALLEKLVDKPTRFLGMVGSTAKREIYFERMRMKGFSNTQLSHVACPVGLPIGGKSPKEIALSIGAQVIQIFHQLEVPEQVNHTTSLMEHFQSRFSSAATGSYISRQV